MPRRPERKQFPLRISQDLFDAYESWAADELRSINAQIEAVLTDAARRAGRLRPGRRGGSTGGNDGVSPAP